MEDLFSFCDEFGPAKIIHVYEPSAGLKGILVLDNVARGPSIGGVRIAPDVSVEECFRLARAMTFKNAAAGLPHGGGKMVIYGDPKMPDAQKQYIMRAAASALRYEEDYIFGALFALNAESKSVAVYPGGKALEQNAIIDIECEIWIPAARRADDGLCTRGSRAHPATRHHPSTRTHRRRRRQLNPPSCRRRSPRHSRCDGAARGQSCKR